MRLNRYFRFLLVLWLLMVGASTSAAQRDQKAVDVLHAMNDFLATLKEYKVEGAAYTDARLDDGLMVANPSEVLLLVDRPNSIFLQQFDGVDRHEFYLNGATFTQYNSATNYSGASRDHPMPTPMPHSEFTARCPLWHTGDGLVISSREPEKSRGGAGEQIFRLPEFQFPRSPARGFLRGDLRNSGGAGSEWEP
jgi:hypothetical protein